MNNIRVYGEPPYSVAVLHGGPGAPGEMAPVALSPLSSWEIASGDGHVKQFSIKQATLELCSPIVQLVQEAYFQEKLLHITHRDPARKNTFAIADIERRIRDRQKYTVLVCTLQEGSAEKVVGTIYYQFMNADFKDQHSRELAELGMLVVHPDYTKKFEIGDRLINHVKEFASGDKKALYLYAIGSYKGGKYTNRLLEYYADRGFEPAGNRTSSKSDIYTTASKCVEQLVMLYDPLQRTDADKIRSITRTASSEVYPIPFIE